MTIWLAAVAMVGNPWAIDPATSEVRAVALERAAPLFAASEPAIRIRGICLAQTMGLVECYPDLMREVRASEPEVRKAAISAVFALYSRRNSFIPLPGEEGGQRFQGVVTRERQDEVWRITYRNDVISLVLLNERVEEATDILLAPAAERITYLRSLLSNLSEDVEYEREEISSEEGIRTGVSAKDVLKFVAPRLRDEFLPLAVAHLANAKNGNRSDLLSVIAYSKLGKAIEPAIRPLLEHRQSAIRVPAVQALISSMPKAEVAALMTDSFGSIRVLAFWEMHRRDPNMAFRIAMPRLLEMFSDERQLVLTSFQELGPAERKKVEDLTRHNNKQVAADAKTCVDVWAAEHAKTIRP